MPGPSLSAREFESLEEDSERRQYAHYHMYHTMFVGGLLAGALLGAEVDPPSPDAESDAGVDCTRESMVTRRTIRRSPR